MTPKVGEYFKSKDYGDIYKVVDIGTNGSTGEHSVVIKPLMSTYCHAIPIGLLLSAFEVHHLTSWEEKCERIYYGL